VERLLKVVESGLLWLLADNAGAECSLRKEVAARRNDPARLVFANQLPLEE
jgi:hypothetical protein